ncbi:MAG: hypothetical protein ACREOO_32605 [bacterium]
MIHHQAGVGESLQARGLHVKLNLDHQVRKERQQNSSASRNAFLNGFCRPCQVVGYLYRQYAVEAAVFLGEFQRSASI